MSTAVSVPTGVLAPFLFIAFTVGIVTVALLLARWQNRKARENLERLASALGLAVISDPPRPVIGASPPRLEGTYRGRALRTYSYTTGTGKSRMTWCALATNAPNPGGLSLEVKEENLLTQAGRVFGVDDVSLGDEAFDRRFFVKSNDPAFIRAALIPEVRARFTEAWPARALGTLMVAGSEVKYVESGSFANAGVCERFAGFAALVCDVAEIVEVHRA